MANWTKILLGYCDGGMHQGNRKIPISFKGSRLYFRGAVNTRSHFQWILQKYPNFKNSFKKCNVIIYFFYFYFFYFRKPIMLQIMF